MLCLILAATGESDSLSTASVTFLYLLVFLVDGQGLIAFFLFAGTDAVSEAFEKLRADLAGSQVWTEVSSLYRSR